MIHKHILAALIMLFTSAHLVAQSKTTGAIYYTQTTYPKAMMSGSGAASFSGASINMPDKITSEFELLFNASGAKYHKYTDSGNPAQAGGIVISFGGSSRELYYNFSNNKITEYVPFDGENYLMDGKLGVAATDTVEQTNDTKTIIGFNCKKAVIKGKTGVTEVWYTNDLKFSASPVLTAWTDGVVLAIHSKRADYIATSVDWGKVKDSEIAPPKDGKLITAEEFKTKQEAYLKKMQSGNGRVIRFNQ